MLHKYAELNRRYTLYKAASGILRTKLATRVSPPFKFMVDRSTGHLKFMRKNTTGRGYVDGGKFTHSSGAYEFPIFNPTTGKFELMHVPAAGGKADLLAKFLNTPEGHLYLDRWHDAIQKDIPYWKVQDSLDKYKIGYYKDNHASWMPEAKNTGWMNYIGPLSIGGSLLYGGYRALDSIGKSDKGYRDGYDYDRDDIDLSDSYYHSIYSSKRK